MPVRTVYVKEEHQKLWDRAKEIMGDESLSELVAEGLERVIRAREAVQEGFERVELVVGEYRYGSSRTIAFQGRLAAESGYISAYITPKRNILVHFNYPTDGIAYHKIYGSIEEAGEEENNDGEQLYPSEFLQEIAEELGEEYIEELDI